MPTWNNLLTSALLGTERRVAIFDDDAPPLVARLESGDAAHTLLLSAAVSALYRRAGYEPPLDEQAALSPAPSEIEPRCPYRALSYLETLLQESSRYHNLLPEWLAHLARRGRRVPHPYLPPLLDLAKKRTDLRPFAALIAGERGRWLAAQNPGWHYLMRINPDEARGLIQEPAPVDDAALLQLLQNDLIANMHIALRDLLKGGSIVTPDLLEAIFDTLFQKPGMADQLRVAQLLQLLASAIAPPLLPQAIQRLARETANGFEGLEPTLHLLKFRRDMLRELDND